MARSMSRVSFSPTTEPMLPMMKAESVTPKATRRARIMPVPTIAASRRPVRVCSAFNRSAYGFLSAKPSGSVGSRSANHSSNVPSSSTWAIRSWAETYQWKSHSGQTPNSRWASLRKIVCWQPGQRCQSPSGTPRLGRLVPGCQVLLVESLVAIDPLTRNLLPRRHRSRPGSPPG